MLPQALRPGKPERFGQRREDRRDHGYVGPDGTAYAPDCVDHAPEVARVGGQWSKQVPVMGALDALAREGIRQIRHDFVDVQVVATEELHRGRGQSSCRAGRSKVMPETEGRSVQLVAAQGHLNSFASAHHKQSRYLLSQASGTGIRRPVAADSMAPHTMARLLMVS